MITFLQSTKDINAHHFNLMNDAFQSYEFQKRLHVKKDKIIYIEQKKEKKTCSRRRMA